MGPAPVNTFTPDRALGAGVDGLEKGEVAKVYTPSNLAEMRSAGLRSLTFRLRTELGVEAWHWNPAGGWSDAERRQGYWTSSAQAASPIGVCYGYRLPRRGSTIDQANNDSYSRVDDGDPASFWKSNPYLDRHYTHEDNALHPQWLVIDLGRREQVDAIRLLWGVPFATAYRVEFWEGVDPIYIDENPPGRWRPFPGGAVLHGRGGDVTLRLTRQSVSARYLRITMTASSYTAPPGSRDVRDRLGFAMKEIYLGRIQPSTGRLRDILRHGRRKQLQTVIYASSTDPWHRPQDLDCRIEQPGFDRVFRSGLSSGLTVIVPVGLLYDTPDNAAAELRFLRTRGYRVNRIELGEEPDGQYMTPEDYGALYVQWADALHRVDPRVELGGPSFQTSVRGWHAWPDARGNRSWMNRFLTYLRRRSRESDFRFFSFEWYPFDDVCAKTAPQLAAAPQLLSRLMGYLHSDGLSHRIPWIIAEYGYSAFAGQAEVELPAALLNAETVAQFLTLGGSAAYLYGYEPNEPIKESTSCDTWGNLMMLEGGENRQARYRLPAYYAASLLANEWAQPGSGVHGLYRAESSIYNGQGQPLVTSYAVHRPDGRWSLVLINKDPVRAWQVHVQFDRDGATSDFSGPADLYQYSSAQYAWHPAKDQGRPIRSLPPSHRELAAAPGRVMLPPYSLTILRGRVAGL